MPTIHLKLETLRSKSNKCCRSDVGQSPVIASTCWSWQKAILYKPEKSYRRKRHKTVQMFRKNIIEAAHRNIPVGIVLGTYI